MQKKLFLSLLLASQFNAHAWPSWLNPFNLSLIKKTYSCIQVWLYPAYYEKKDIKKYYTQLHKIKDEAESYIKIRKSEKVENKALQDKIINFCNSLEKDILPDLKTGIWKGKAQTYLENTKNTIEEKLSVVFTKTIAELKNTEKSIGLDDSLNTNDWPKLFALKQQHADDSFKDILAKKLLMHMDPNYQACGADHYLDRRSVDENMNRNMHNKFQQLQEQKDRLQTRVLPACTPISELMGEIYQYPVSSYLGYLPAELQLKVIQFVNHPKD